LFLKEQINKTIEIGLENRRYLFCFDYLFVDFLLEKYCKYQLKLKTLSNQIIQPFLSLFLTYFFASKTAGMEDET